MSGRLTLPTIVVASGKGGTGKTFVSTNLAHVARDTMRVVLGDLDVEEPNCRLFFESGASATQVVTTMVPIVDFGVCQGCGVCGSVCEFNAIVNVSTGVLVFPELCHGCYACLELCPLKAITSGSKVIGNTSVSEDGAMTLVSGELSIGQPAATPLIAATKRRAAEAASTGRNEEPGVCIYDAPPGTSCPVVEAMKDADYVVLVAEPTRFGLHDLDLMTRTLALMRKPFGVVVNRAADEHYEIEEYCSREGFEVIQRIPRRRDIALEIARGRLVVDVIPEQRRRFESLLQTVVARANERREPGTQRPNAAEAHGV